MKLGGIWGSLHSRQSAARDLVIREFDVGAEAAADEVLGIEQLRHSGRALRDWNLTVEVHLGIFGIVRVLCY